MEKVDSIHNGFSLVLKKIVKIVEFHIRTRHIVTTLFKIFLRFEKKSSPTEQKFGAWIS